jgi:hypothetical protein
VKNIFLYEASPLDWWTGWTEFENLSNVLIRNYENGDRMHNLRQIEEILLNCKKLIVEGLIKFSKLLDQRKREYTINVNLNTSRKSDHGMQEYYPRSPVVAFKMCNNGTVYALSFMDNLIIPHDFEEKWDMIDIAHLE